MASEKSFENKIKKYLRDIGCWFIKYWGGAVYTKAGVPDLLVCCGGLFLAVEVKGDKGKPSELQLYDIRKIIEAGGYGIVLYPNQFQDFKRLCEFLQSKNYKQAEVLMKKINERR